jgi:regulation of enolase protein 1 (concanavalin A-like superfamily)
MAKEHTTMQWYHQPTTWTVDDGRIRVVTDSKTDFWRKTHYGFIRDNGHFFFQEAGGDFVVDVNVRGEYKDLYDQAGLMIRADEITWVKCGIEFVDGVQHASVVVTHDYSDWSVIPIDGSPLACWFRMTRQGGDLEVQYSLDGIHYRLLRIAHFSMADPLQVGIMCASPEGSGFSVAFESFSVRSTTANTDT